MGPYGSQNFKTLAGLLNPAHASHGGVSYFAFVCVCVCGQDISKSI